MKRKDVTFRFYNLMSCSSTGGFVSSFSRNRIVKWRLSVA